MAMQTGTTHSYWVGMKHKAGENLAGITHHDVPETEDEAKAMVSYAMKHGTYQDAACAIGEYCEWIMSHLMLEMRDATVGAV